MAGRTISEKIIASHTDDPVEPGTLVTVAPDWVVGPDLSAHKAIERMAELGHDDVANPDRVHIAFDHHAPPSFVEMREQLTEVEAWIDRTGIGHFHDIGSGILHNVVAEEGYALPGQLLLGADSHTCTLGAFGSFATGIGILDFADLLGTGELWLKVPETRRITVPEKLPDGCSAKDLALQILGELTTRGAIYEAIRFDGPGIEALEMHERQTLTNLAVELGGVTGIVPFDGVTEAYLADRAVEAYEPVAADGDADYVGEHTVAVESLEPLLAEPPRVDNVGTVAENAGTPVDQVFVGTCNNGRWEDVEAFAAVLGTETVARGTDLIVVPGSKETLKRMNESGVSNAIIDAGGVVETPGCGPCMGGHSGVLGEGDTCLGTMNRNFPGRMGPGEIYMGSPETAAATAIYGEIADPREVV